MTNSLLNFLDDADVEAAAASLFPLRDLPPNPESLAVSALSWVAHQMAASNPNPTDKKRLAALQTHNGGRKIDPSLASMDGDAFVRFCRMLLHFMSLAADYRPETYTIHALAQDRPIVESRRHEDVSIRAYATLVKSLGMSNVGAAITMMQTAQMCALSQGVPAEQILRIHVECLLTLLQDMPCSRPGRNPASGSVLASMFEEMGLFGADDEESAPRTPRQRPGRRRS